MSEGIKLTEDKIKTLGRAITDKADVLFEAYSPEGCYGAVNTSSKQYKMLRDSGVISINANSITLGSSFRDILRTVDQKSYRTHTMPDVEDWKQNIHHSIQMAQAASDSFDETHDEMMYLANIRDEANMLSEALGREMANIEYIINSDLNNTPNIKAKRIILESLNKKIKSQIQKTAILGREELYKLHGDYTKAAVILDEYLSDSIVKFNHEMGVHLDKTILLIDKLKKEQNRQNKILWQLHKALRNEQFIPKQMRLELRDIESIGLAFGGIDVSDNLYNIELSDDSYLLATIMDKLASSKPITQGKEIKIYEGEYVESTDKAEQQKPSPEKIWVLKYLSNNNTDDLSRCYSVREYWQTAGLTHVVEYKAFLALVLKVCGSNFKNDHIIKKKDTCYWKLYLKKRWLSDTCDTLYITDAKYVRCHTTSTEPSEKEFKTLLDIQQKLQAGEDTIAFKTHSNVFALLVVYDADIGHKIGRNVHIKPGGWNRIVSLIKAHTKIDIARDDIAAMKTKDRVDNSLTMSNEKILSKAPTEGFFELRLLGSDDDVVIATRNYMHRASKQNAYLGVHSDDLMQWSIDNLIVIENFTSFCRFTEQDLTLVEGWHGQTTALVYRGHKAGSTALIYESLKNIKCHKYVFADYDFAGLGIAQSIGKAILADGFILPKEPWLDNNEMLDMNKKQTRLVQAHITISHPALQPYYNHLKNNFLAITQEALVARSIPLTIVNI